MGKGTSRALWLAMGLAALYGAPASAAFECTPGTCSVVGEKPYPNLIVGTIKAIATPDQAKALFLAGRAQGLWATLSPDPAQFAAKIQPVSISLPSGGEQTVLMMMEEQRAAPLKPGDFGRFSPHQPSHEHPANPNDPYWVAVGCVATLCSASDKTCPLQYKPGIYRLKDGVQLAADGTHPLPGGITINTESMLPKPAVPSKTVH